MVGLIEHLAEPVRSFYDIVLPVVANRSVLDVGSISHSYVGRAAYKIWNFDVLARQAEKIKGIDILTEDVALARRDGYDIDVGNAETYIAAEQYDVVFAGDLIEHLSNPGLFLDCSYRNLVDGGTLVRATPNTYSLTRLVRVCMRFTNEPPVNPEHTFYFTPSTLTQLISRHGFQISSIHYCNFEYAPEHGSIFKRMQLSINAWACGALPRFAQTIVAICRKVGDINQANLDESETPRETCE
jgi:SAM-dependent methyltransferase